MSARVVGKPADQGEHKLLVSTSGVSPPAGDRLHRRETVYLAFWYLSEMILGTALSHLTLW